MAAQILAFPLLKEACTFLVTAIVGLWAVKNPPKLPSPSPTPEKIERHASTAETVLDDVRAIQIPADKLEKTKKNCEKCPPCIPPVGSRCATIHTTHTHWPCENLLLYIGHIHVLLRSQSPPPVCRCFWIRGKKNVVCIPRMISIQTIQIYLVASGISPCPNELI